MTGLGRAWIDCKEMTASSGVRPIVVAWFGRGGEKRYVFLAHEAVACQS